MPAPLVPFLTEEEDLELAGTASLSTASPSSPNQVSVKNKQSELLSQQHRLFIVKFVSDLTFHNAILSFICEFAFLCRESVLDIIICRGTV